MNKHRMPGVTKYHVSVTRVSQCCCSMEADCRERKGRKVCKYKTKPKPTCTCCCTVTSPARSCSQHTTVGLIPQPGIHNQLFYTNPLSHSVHIHAVEFALKYSLVQVTTMRRLFFLGFASSQCLKSLKSSCSVFLICPLENFTAIKKRRRKKNR